MLMDEPFSAVDPIVRDGLQQEFLRLQAELGKTIAFVTHDIDEAIKLGDKVAIFREGGHLAQVGTPQELLDDPADEFVADFVGRDRGFRGLSFLTAEQLDGRAGRRVRRPRRRRTPGARRRRPARRAGAVDGAERSRPLPGDVHARRLAAAGDRPGHHLAGGSRGAGRRRRRRRRRGRPRGDRAAPHRAAPRAASGGPRR